MLEIFRPDSSSMAIYRQLALPGMRRVLTLILPSIGNMVFVSILLVLVFGTGNGLLYDGDTGYHIRTGEEILKNWRIPVQDIFSAHLPTLHWTAHEWLSEVILAAVFKLSGLTGIVIFFALLLAVTHWLLYFVLSQKSANLTLVTLTTFLATATSSSHWLARPHVFSLLLTLVWYHILDRFQQESHDRLFYLPILMILWVNLHGGYFFGLVLVGLYFGGNLMSSFFTPPQESIQHRKKAKTLFTYLLLTVTACVINPLGFEILLYPMQFMSDRFLMDRVIEFLSPNFHEALPFKYMLLTTIAALAFSRAPLNLIECGLVLLVSYMALYSARYMSLFAIIVAPLLLKSGDSVISNLPAPVARFFHTRNRNLAEIDKKVWGYVWPTCAALLVVGLGLAGRLQFNFDEKRFPVEAVKFLNQERITGNMFNNDEFGDYIIFSSWPKYRVFMDGRSDMYGKKLGSAYLQVANVLPGWKEILAQNKISWIIFDTNSALTAALGDDQDWQPIYTDQVATIFIKKNADHGLLLAKYPAVDLRFSK